VPKGGHSGVQSSENALAPAPKRKAVLIVQTLRKDLVLYGTAFLSLCASRDSNAGPSAPEADALSS
jgi:hypothetical protein